MKSPIRATLNARPRLTLPVMRCDNSILPGTKTALAKLPPSKLAAHVVVPVHQALDKTTLSQETAPLWDRQLVTDPKLGPPSFSSFILLSSRDRWRLREETVEIFDRSVVIDGARRLEAAYSYPSMGDIPVAVIFGLQSSSELSLRKQIQHSHATTTLLETRERFDTTAPRLSIGEKWVDVNLCSEPFVVPTKLGYSPAILVRRPAASHSEHILVGAKSLALELQSIRRAQGTLIGTRVLICKQGPEKTAPYLLQVQETPKG